MNILDTYELNKIYKTLHKSLFYGCLDVIKRYSYKTRRNIFTAPTGSTDSEIKNVYDQLYCRYLDFLVKDNSLRNVRVRITDIYNDCEYSLFISDDINPDSYYGDSYHNTPISSDDETQ